MILLDAIDSKILAVLARKELHSSLIGRNLDIPRTSISYRLKRLEKFHKVTKHGEGRKVVWRLTPKRIHNKSLIHEFRDTEFLECYKNLSTLPKNSLIYAVQGSGAAKAVFQAVPEEFMREIHSTMKRRNIIMRAIANKAILETVNSLDTSLKKSHKGRPQSVKLLDENFLSGGELFVTQHFVSIINPKKKLGVVIKDDGIVQLLYDLMHLVFTLSDRIDTFDLNAHIEKQL